MLTIMRGMSWAIVRAATSACSIVRNMAAQALCKHANDQSLGGLITSVNLPLHRHLDGTLSVWLA